VGYVHSRCWSDGLREGGQLRCKFDPAARSSLRSRLPTCVSYGSASQPSEILAKADLTHFPSLDLLSRMSPVFFAFSGPIRESNNRIASSVAAGLKCM
jgi:hypothetical protein